MGRPARRLRHGGLAEPDERPGTLKIEGAEIELTGLDDPHIKRDRYARVAGGPSESADFSMGVVHAPYLRTLDAFTADGYP